MADPDRIVVDLAEVNFQLDPSVGRFVPRRSDPMVEAIRSACSDRASRASSSISRAPPASRELSRRRSPRVTTTRLGHGVEACEARAFASAARMTPPGAAAPRRRPPKRPRRLPSRPAGDRDRSRTGGVDGGAYGVDGAVEKSLVFDSPRASAPAGSDGSLPGRDDAPGRRIRVARGRVRKARAANAALFVSIHADSSRGGRGGLRHDGLHRSERASDAEAARIAERENDADKPPGSNRSRGAGRRRHLFDLKRRETRVYSHLFSRRSWRNCRARRAQPESRALGRLRRAQGARRPFGADGTRLSLQRARRPVDEVGRTGATRPRARWRTPSIGSSPSASEWKRPPKRRTPSPRRTRRLRPRGEVQKIPRRPGKAGAGNAMDIAAQAPGDRREISRDQL